jgi:hypothetical protein
MLSLPDFVIHRVFLNSGYGDCISVGSKTRAISSQSYLPYATPAAQAAERRRTGY